MANNLLTHFEGGTAVLVLTPENQISKEIIGDTNRTVANYRKVLLFSIRDFHLVFLFIAQIC